MKYFWWRLADYGTGVFVGGGIILLISKFLCNKCLGTYTTVLFLAIWIGFMLIVNFIFQRMKPASIGSK
ncbi:MAG TPA: hypothetical protein VJ792_06700 [Candidatus Nitrosotalea sp.]|nr:hypothetical protein [Candidatus Nitrosotalea sp.]